MQASVSVISMFDAVSASRIGRTILCILRCRIPMQINKKWNQCGFCAEIPSCEPTLREDAPDMSKTYLERPQVLSKDFCHPNNEI